MRPYRLPSYFLVLCLIMWAILSDATAAWAQVSSWTPTRPSNDANTRKGFDHFYNLEYDKALRDFEAAQQAHPDDPFPVNHVLGTVIFRELFRIGALDTESFAGDAFLQRQSTPLDPKVREQVNA